MTTALTDELLAFQSGSVTMPTGHMHRFNPGDLVPSDVYLYMSEEYRGRVLRDPALGIEEEVLDDSTVFAEPEADGFVGGTSDDPRLAGAPGVGASVPAQIKWVADDETRAEAVYDRELRKTKPRPSLLEALAPLLDGSNTP